LMLAVALAIRLTSRGPVMFAHHRVGRGGRSFHCLKFRSMVIDADVRLAKLLERDPVARAEWARDHKLQRDPRITRVGRFLRRSSLDELPQLFNVLGGSMSLVGPRPIVRGEIARYGSHFADYCKVRPGITGLWQVNGRSNTTYRQRVAMDVIYVRRRSIVLNGLIIAKTVPAVMLQRALAEHRHAPRRARLAPVRRAARLGQARRAVAAGPRPRGKAAACAGQRILAGDRTGGIGDRGLRRGRRQ